VSVVVCHDAIHVNVPRLPPGQAAGYTTGTPMIRWTGADGAAHPGWVRICQDAAASDHTADVLDVEQYAATNSEAAGWYRAAEKSYVNADRPGQRSPALYTSASNVTPLVNALLAGGVKSGPGLWVANWNLSQAQAYADVVNAAGPFPIIGVQWASGAFYDTNVFSGTWLAKVSAQVAMWREVATDGTFTLQQAAEDAHMLPSSVLRHTATHYGAFDATVSAYVDGLAAGTLDPEQPIPAGGKLWVRA
jgi:hypothetical protein